MPTVTPGITLNFTLLDYSGAELGSATQPAWLRIALCGYGANIPRVCGAGMIGEVASWFVDIPYYGTPGSTLLWGNDQIIPGPDITFYAISVLDTQKNVVQTQNYQWDGVQTVDLGCAAPYNPPPTSSTQTLKIAPCSGAVPGTAYVAPGTLVPGGVFYNGTQLRQDQALPILSYTQSGASTIALNFTTEVGDADNPPDRIDALCWVVS